jgi:DNA mismatch endonuclease, patch repair protein
MPDNLTAPQRRRNMRAVRTKNTAPELLVRSLLHRLGYRFRLHREDLAGTPDIVFSSRKRVIFVHGCFWHGHSCKRGRPSASNKKFWQRKIAGNKSRDTRVKRKLFTQGWKALTIWECETKDLDRLKGKLNVFLDSIDD